MSSRVRSSVERMRMALMENKVMLGDILAVGTCPKNFEGRFGKLFRWNNLGLKSRDMLNSMLRGSALGLRSAFVILVFPRGVSPWR